MKKKKFRRDTRFFNDFFLKKSTATRCKNCQGTPNFGIHGKIVLWNMVGIFGIKKGIVNLTIIYKIHSILYHTNIVIFLIFIENILLDTFLFYEENCKPPTVKYDACKNQLFMQDPISKWSLLNLDTINQHPSDSFKEAVLIIPVIQSS